MTYRSLLKNPIRPTGRLTSSIRDTISVTGFPKTTKIQIALSRIIHHHQWLKTVIPDPFNKEDYPEDAFEFKPVTK